MFGIGGFELFLILLFGFLIFGPDKLPAMAKTLGKAINKFRSAQEEMNKVLKTEVYDPTSDEPFKNPLEALSKVGEIGKDDKEEKTESFSERKARYDKERAAKKPDGSFVKPEEPKAAETAKPAAKPESTAAKPKPSPDELYGTKPAAKKPATKPTAAKAAAASKSAAKPTAKTDAEKAAARSAAAKKAAATRAANRKAAAEAAAKANKNEKGE